MIGFDSYAKGVAPGDPPSDKVIISTRVDLFTNATLDRGFRRPIYGILGVIERQYLRRCAYPHLKTEGHARIPPLRELKQMLSDAVTIKHRGMGRLVWNINSVRSADV